MRFRVSSYFFIAAVGLSLIVLVQDPGTGLVFLAATMAICGPIALVPGNAHYRGIVIFVAVWLFAISMVRVPFLVGDPTALKFPGLGGASTDVIRAALWDVAGFAAIFLTILAVGLRGTRRRAERIRRPGPRLVLSGRLIVLLIALVTVGTRLILQLGFGFYTKHQRADPETAFLTNVTPEFYLYPLGVLYLLKYRKTLGKGETILWGVILTALSVSSMIGGSRRFLGIILLSVFIYFLDQRSDSRAGVTRVTAAAAAVVLGLFASFGIAAEVRGVAAEQGYGVDIARGAWTGLARSLTPASVGFFGDRVTRRVSALDGLVATHLHQPPELKEVLSVPNTLGRVVERLIPRYRSGSMSSGAAIGYYYGGTVVDHGHAGAIGLIGTLHVVFGGWRWVAVALLGFLTVLYFRFADGLDDPDIAYLLRFTGMMALMGWLLSGNMDNGVAGLIRNLSHLVFYGFIVWLVVHASTPSLRKRSPRPRTAAGMLPVNGKQF